MEFLQYGFIQRALIAGIFIGITCAVLGVFLVLRRLSLIGDGLAHLSFGTVALGLWLGLYPFAVSIPLVVLGSLVVFKITEKANLYGDVAIGIISAAGIAGGVLLASIGGGLNVDLFSYLFGNILAVSGSEALFSIVLCAVVIGTIFFYYREFVALAFDPEHAHVSGVAVGRLNIIFIMLTGLTVVLAIRVVGVMLISALLILPAVTAFQWSRGFKASLVAAVLTAVVSVLCGIGVSVTFDLPTGATIVLMNLIFFLSAWGSKELKGPRKS